MKNKNLQITISFLITLGALYWIFHSLDWSDVLEHLSGLSYMPFVWVTFLILLQFYVRGVRWRFLLPPDRAPGDRLLTKGVILGNFVNYILPFRVGELVRVFFLKKRSRVSFSAGAVSVVTERVLDVVVVLLSFAIVAPMVEDIPSWVARGALLLGVVALGLGAAVLMSAFFPSFVHRVAEGALTLCPHQGLRGFLSKNALSLIDGASALREPRNLIGSLVTSVIIWLLTFFMYYLYLFPFRDAEPIFLYGVLAAILIGLAVSAPSAPGGLGVYQLGCVAALTLGPYDKELAAAYALLTHFHQYIIVIGCGFIIVMREQLSLAKLRDPSGELSSRG